ncbi:hypothetical protein BCON_0074g00260 [Botryotinia convoluta]|uniref:Uncharacterized protein n=1 Tax=Botryotinia convoluta TaxID=54673 RepID=A0A4Z1I602_9HELO|nr:hypothetical protein BCON_0074g00260 [Botryotinia convoluta]
MTHFLYNGLSHGFDLATDEVVNLDSTHGNFIALGIKLFDDSNRFISLITSSGFVGPGGLEYSDHSDHFEGFEGSEGSEGSEGLGRSGKLSAAVTVVTAVLVELQHSVYKPPQLVDFVGLADPGVVLVAVVVELGEVHHCLVFVVVAAAASIAFANVVVAASLDAAVGSFETWVAAGVPHLLEWIELKLQLYVHKKHEDFEQHVVEQV